MNLWHIVFAASCFCLTASEAGRGRLRNLQFTDNEWGYSEGTGSTVLTPPWSWGNMRQQNSCAGKGQSPITISRSFAQDAPVQAIDATVVQSSAQRMYVVGPSGTRSSPYAKIEGMAQESFGAFSVPGEAASYAAISIDLHEPSEHVLQLDDAAAAPPQQFAGEIQVVFKRSTSSALDEYVIYSLLYRNGSGALNDWDKLGVSDTNITMGDQGSKDHVAMLDLSSTKTYAHYYGSLTKPPCTETVKWVVNTDVREVRAAQLAVLRKLWQGSTSRSQPNPQDASGKPGVVVPTFKTRDDNGRPIVFMSLTIEGTQPGTVVAVVVCALLIPPVLLIFFFRVFFGK